MEDERHERHDIEAAMHDPRISDADEELVSREGLDDSDVDQIVRLMQSLRGWHTVERRMSAASTTSRGCAPTPT